MKESEAQEIIEEAIRKVADMSPRSTDGKWLEVVTVESGPCIKEWDMGECWHWDEWPGREARFPNTTKLDVGIDAVAVRRSDGEHIAIQCKSLRLDNEGRGSSIKNNEIAKFATASAFDFWAERWVDKNGDNSLANGMFLNGDEQFNLLMHRCALIEERANGPPTMDRHVTNN